MAPTRWHYHLMWILVGLALQSVVLARGCSSCYVRAVASDCLFLYLVPVQYHPATLMAHIHYVSHAATCEIVAPTLVYLSGSSSVRLTVRMRWISFDLRLTYCPSYYRRLLSMLGDYASDSPSSDVGPLYRLDVIPSVGQASEGAHFYSGDTNTDSDKCRGFLLRNCTIDNIRFSGGLLW